MADLDIYRDKIARGSMTYEDAADLFLSTVVGQSSGESHAGVLARLRAHFADQAALNAWLQRAYAAVPPQFKPRHND